MRPQLLSRKLAYQRQIYASFYCYREGSSHLTNYAIGSVGLVRKHWHGNHGLAMVNSLHDKGDVKFLDHAQGQTTALLSPVDRKSLGYTLPFIILW